MKEPVPYSAPAFWASYLINGDGSGLSEDEKRYADEFVAKVGLGGPVDCAETGFAWHCDAHNLVSMPRLGGDFCVYTFLQESA